MAVAIAFCMSIFGCETAPVIRVDVFVKGSASIIYRPNVVQEPIVLENIKGTGQIEFIISGIPLKARWETLSTRLDMDIVTCHVGLVETPLGKWEGAVSNDDKRCIDMYGPFQRSKKSIMSPGESD